MMNTLSESEQQLWDQYCEYSGETFDSVYKNKDKIQAFRDWFNQLARKVYAIKDVYEDYMDMYIEIHTNKLNDHNYINQCLDDLNLIHNSVMKNNIRLNTNKESGYKKTEVKKSDIDKFERFIDKAPINILNRTNLFQLNVNQNNNIIISMFFLFALFFLFKFFYMFFLEWLKSYYVYSVFKNIGNKLFKVYLSQPLMFHYVTSTSDLIANITSDLK